MTAGSFSVDAARALGGPEWLTARRVAAAEQLAGVEWPTDAEEIWRYSRINDLDLGRYRPLTAEELGAPDAERAPGGGPFGAELGDHAALVVVRDGRVVHHEVAPELEAQGVTVCGIARCDQSLIEPWLGSVSDASPDAFTQLHDAFLAGGAFVHVPRGVAVAQPIVVVQWADGDGLSSFPHTLVVAEEASDVTIVERHASPPKVEHF